MLLVWLLKNVVYRLICGSVDIQVSDIIYDSRKDVSGSVFVCLKGYALDGHDYAKDAMARGAGAVVIQQDISAKKRKVLQDIALEKNVCLISVTNTRKALGEMSRAFFGYPEKKLTLIGITGTKGKTTTAGILKNILDRADIPSGLIGTTGIFTGKHHFLSANTTPESYLIQKYLRMMADDGCRAAIMEVSSQALMCQRVCGMLFDYAIFTNVSPDHIGPGEHQSFEEYIYWKGQLFSQCHVGIFNGTDSNVIKAIKNCNCCLESFGILDDKGCSALGEELPLAPGEPTKKTMAANLDWEARELKNILEPRVGTQFIARKNGDEHKLFLSLPGSYNVENALPAVAAARHMDISWENIRKGLENVRVCGRCEVLGKCCGGCFILDYAHNGKSLETILKTLRQYNPRRLICIFGCGGNRSRLRRTDMARAAAMGADHLIITTDNPRYEAPLEIIRDIEKEIIRLTPYFPKLQKNGFYEIIEDRRAAICHAVKIMGSGDIVLLAGKGHENYQEIAGKRYPFDEHEIVREEIKREA